VDRLLTSYEERVSCMGAMLDSTFQVLQESQNPLAGMQEERERIKAELRERLAKTNSLRRKDFDRMIQDLLASQREQEQEMRNLLSDYLNEQKALAQGLRDGLARLTDSATEATRREGKATAAERLRSLLKETPIRQEQCRAEMHTKLEQFQQKQEALITGLRELLARGEDLRIKDFKLMLERFRTDRVKRLARRQQRRDETLTLLNEFREERAKLGAPRRKEAEAPVPQSMPSGSTGVPPVPQALVHGQDARATTNL
jgi:LPS O-antigen subunit length determinant protein (WzzB/FepE family)